MKTHLFLSVLGIFLTLLATHSPASAQQIFRCVNANGGAPEYTNNAKDALARSCQTVSGGNVTVVQGTQVAPKAGVLPAAVSASGAVKPVSSTSNSTSNNSNAEQRMRDSDARTILQAELKKAESRLAEQQKEYNNGEPEKQGIEGRNYQRYLDRVADLKDGISRNQNDIAGLKRELSRLPVSSMQ